MLRITLMSSAIILALIFGMALQAHELRPAVAKVAISQTELKIELLATAETLLAGINLTEILDTNEAPKAATYDALRGFDDDALARSVWAKWPQLSTEFVLEGAEDLRLMNVEVIPEPNLKLPRETKLFMVANLSEGSAPIRFGWSSKNGGLVVRHGEGDGAYAGFLEEGGLSLPLPRAGVVKESNAAVFWRFIIEGFEHIIPKGLDHILFVFGLFLFSLSWRPLLLQITAFTLAHTATLGLATLSVITIPVAQIWLVEALIAGSIAYVAIENIWRLKLGWWRVVIVFGFGLLHGIGFASVLGDLGLAQGQFVLSLIAFNIGIESGQLTVIAIGFATLALPFGKSPLYRSCVVIPGSTMIALVGVWWAFERTFL